MVVEMLQHQVARDGRTVKSEKTNCRQMTRYMVPPTVPDAQEALETRGRKTKEDQLQT